MRPEPPGSLTLRTEVPGDAASIRRIVRSAFGGAGEAALVDALREHGKVTVSRVACLGDRPVGYVLFSPVTLDGRVTAPPGLGLAPLAVLPSCQGRGIGSRLVACGLAACRRAGYGYVVVLGHPGFYGRCGFEPASARRLTCAYGGGDAFRVAVLASGALPAAGGRIEYAAEFAALDAR